MVNKEGQLPGELYTFEQLDEAVDAVTPPTTHQLVLTGGEPTIWGAGINDWLESGNPEELGKNGAYFDHIEMETNGTLMPVDGLLDKITQFNVSPKLSNNQRGKNNSGAPANYPVKGDDFSRRIHPEVLRFYNDLHRGHSYFKFVVEDMGDISEIRGLRNEYTLDDDKIIIMPEGTTTEVLLERSKWLAQVCKQEGWRLTPRWQILLFGNVRAT